MDKEIISGAYHTVEFKIMGIFGAKERVFFTKAQTDGTRFVLNNR